MKHAVLLLNIASKRSNWMIRRVKGSPSMRLMMNCDLAAARFHLRVVRTKPLMRHRGLPGVWNLGKVIPFLVGHVEVRFKSIDACLPPFPTLFTTSYQNGRKA